MSMLLRYLGLLCFGVYASISPAYSQNDSKIRILGAGSTFAYPLYSKWASEYQKKHPTTQINYQSIGSGAGIRQFIDGTVDFGASDAPMTDEQMTKVPGGVVHVPIAIGPVVIAFHLPGVEELKLSESLLLDLFLGRIKRWDDPKITELNPNLKTALQKSYRVTPVYRSDASGTTAVFTDYLSKISPEWKSKIGSKTAVKWPVGIGAKGNEGVTGIVKQVPGTLTYTEYTFAKKTGMPMALIQNPSGKFIAPSEQSVSKAADAFKNQIPEDFRFSITHAPGEDSYPISSFTYALIRKTEHGEKQREIRRFLIWGMSDEAQNLALELHYAPIPKTLRARILKAIPSL
jgi:phosphate transport system substrate-binding protein